MMPKTVVALVVCGLWCVSQLMADDCTSSVNIVKNCGFETGNFNAWTISGNTANPGGNYYGVDTFDAHSGTYGAYMSQDYVDGGTAPVKLSQTLATIVGDPYTVTFWLEQDTAPTTGYTHAFSATWNGTTLFSVTPSVNSPGDVGSWVEYSFGGTATGATTTLQFSFQNDDNFWSFDDISVVAPEPTSAGLLVLASFSTLLLLWSRRRRLSGQRLRHI